MSELDSGWFWVLVVVSFFLGGSIGFALASRRLPAVQRSQELEAELDKMKAEVDEYRGRVNQHFTETSKLFEGLTERYSEVYKHLAGGAHALCTDAQGALGLELPDCIALPARGRAEPGPGESAEQSNKEIEGVTRAPEDAQAGARERPSHGA